MEKRELSSPVGGNVSGAATMESSIKVPQETKNSCHMIHQSYSYKIIIQKETRTPVFTASAIYNS